MYLSPGPAAPVVARHQTPADVGTVPRRPRPGRRGGTGHRSGLSDWGADRSARSGPLGDPFRRGAAVRCSAERSGELERGNHGTRARIRTSLQTWTRVCYDPGGGSHSSRTPAHADASPDRVERHDGSAADVRDRLRLRLVPPRQLADRDAGRPREIRHRRPRPGTTSNPVPMMTPALAVPPVNVRLG